jgi:hypothetical protein
MLMLRIVVLCGMLHFVSSGTCLPMKMKMQLFFEACGYIPATQHNIPEDQNPQALVFLQNR